MFQKPTLDFCWQGHSFVSFSHHSLFSILHVFSVQKTYQKPFQNEVRTLPKSMPKTCCFLTSFFSGFGLDFGGSWASKSAALLAAPGVLNPTAFYACINILHFLTRGGKSCQNPSRNLSMLGPCWHIFRIFAASALKSRS